MTAMTACRLAGIATELMQHTALNVSLWGLKVDDIHRQILPHTTCHTSSLLFKCLVTAQLVGIVATHGEPEMDVL